MAHRTECKLCGKRRKLQRSHLLPAALYKMMREPRAKVSNPVMITRTTSVSTSPAQAGSKYLAMQFSK